MTQPSLSARTRVALGAGIAVALVGAGGVAGVVVAGGDGAPGPARDFGDREAAARITGNPGAACKTGYDTQSSTNVPPDDSTSDNPPAASVQFKKTCKGAVIAVFTSEIAMPTASDFLHMDMRATCVSKGGLPNSCTVGQQIFASPGHSFFQNGQAPVHTGAIQMAWTGLLPGVWRFEALPGGNNSANLQFRSMAVTAYKGG